MLNAQAHENYKNLARLGGVFYLLIIVISIFGELIVRDSLIDMGNWSETTDNIRNNLFLWRLAIAGDLILILCGIGLTFIYYLLFHAEQKLGALLATFLLLCSFGVEATTKTPLYAISILLESPGYLEQFGQQALNGQIALYYRSYYLGFQNMMVFYSAACLVLAKLVWCSGFLPRFLAVLFGFVGLSHLIHTFVEILFPEFSAVTFPDAMSLTYLSEMLICAWLLVKGTVTQKKQA